jgi:hypothetical protein
VLLAVESAAGQRKTVLAEQSVLDTLQQHRLAELRSTGVSVSAGTIVAQHIAHASGVIQLLRGCCCDNIDNSHAVCCGMTAEFLAMPRYKAAEQFRQVMQHLRKVAPASDPTASTRALLTKCIPALVIPGPGLHLPQRSRVEHELQKCVASYSMIRL